MNATSERTKRTCEPNRDGLDLLANWPELRYYGNYWYCSVTTGTTGGRPACRLWGGIEKARVSDPGLL